MILTTFKELWREELLVIRLVLSLVLYHARLVVMHPINLTWRLRLPARPVMIIHPRERKDIRSCRETRVGGVLLRRAGR